MHRGIRLLPFLPVKTASTGEPSCGTGAHEPNPRPQEADRPAHALGLRGQPDFLIETAGIVALACASFMSSPPFLFAKERRSKADSRSICETLESHLGTSLECVAAQQFKKHSEGTA